MLVKADGVAQDLRLPLADGAKLQILTTRDTQDPDALSVLRHSAAHLLAEAVRRLHPGVKVAIGPPIENGFYYDFEFPSPINEADLEAIEAEVQRELDEGRAWEREEITADEARERFAAEGEPYKVELVDTAEGAISLYTQGDFTDLCRGPHLQTSAPIKAFKLTSLAGAYWRGDENNTQLTRIYGTAFFSQKDLDAHLERLEQARARDHRRLGRELDLFHFDEHSPGSPFWHPKGMAICNALEDLRRRENARRGYAEVKTPLIYDKALWVTSGHWEKFRENMFLIPIDDEHTYAIKPMNCPGHMLLFGSQLRSYRDLPLRYAEAATLHRNELAGALHGLTARALRHPGRRAHLLHAGADRGRDRRVPRLRPLPLRPLRDRAAGRALDAARQQARHRRGVGLHARGAASRRSTATGSTYFVNAGDGVVLRPEDRPSHRPTCSAARGRLGTIQLDSQMPTRFGLTYMGADNREHTAVRRSTARCFGSLERFIGILIEHYGGAFPLWLAPVQVRAARRQRAAPRRRARDRRAAPRGRLPRRGRRARRDARQADPRQRAREDPGRGRLRRARVGGGARRADARGGAVDPLARGAAGGSRGGRGAAASSTERLAPCYAWRLQSRGRYPHLRSRQPGCAGSTESNDEGNGAAACQRLLSFQGRNCTVLKRDTAW